MIGILDLDNFRSGKWRFPNIALMKVSAYYKSLGHKTELYRQDVHYDKVFVSKVFDFTQDIDFIINANDQVLFF